MTVERHASLGAFAQADHRRRLEEEKDLGIWRGDVGWRGPWYRAAWLPDTGELYLMEVQFGRGGGAIGVIAHIDSEADLDTRLAGWENHELEPRSVAWLFDRLGWPSPIAS